MSWELNDEEFQAVLSLPGARRYEYFIKPVAAQSELGDCTARTAGSSLRMMTAGLTFLSGRTRASPKCVRVAIGRMHAQPR
jgi:hypothetical protein